MLFRDYTRDTFASIFTKQRNDCLNFRWGIDTFSRGSNTKGRTKDYLKNYLVVSLRLLIVAGSGARANIDFGKMKLIYDLKMHTVSTKASMGLKKLMVHTDSLEGSMVYDGRSRTPLLAGYVRYNKSPLVKGIESKKFSLNDDGSFKFDPDIRNLVIVKYEADDKTKRHPDLPDPVDLDAARLFSAPGNRMRKRTSWNGLIHTTS